MIDENLLQQMYEEMASQADRSRAKLSQEDNLSQKAMLCKAMKPTK